MGAGVAAGTGLTSDAAPGTAALLPAAAGPGLALRWRAMMGLANKRMENMRVPIFIKGLLFNL